MADSPSTNAGTSSIAPYVVTVAMLLLLGIVLVGLCLYLRPTLDPVVITGVVFAFLTPTFTGIAAFLKSQETHLTVNSQLTSWKSEFYAMSHAEGMLKGASEEQARVAEQKRVAALTPVIPTVPTVLVASATNGEGKKT